MWHILDVRCVWIQEFATALAADANVLGWSPEISWTGAMRNGESERTIERGLQVRRFPLQRGFAKFPFSRLFNEGRRMAARLRSARALDERSTVVLCSPHYFSVAEHWAGPRVYYATDMFRYCGEPSHRIERMERVMCRQVDLVCPNSRRIADYMIETLGVPASKILLLPNATRAENILPACPAGPADLPFETLDLPRPVAGIIGNLATNTDWVLLEQAIERTPWLSWLFVGPHDGAIRDVPQRSARERLLQRRGRVRFVGEKPYGELVTYARALDVAVLPYTRREPTRSGSSTRFYEHLAACRPMIATRGVDELLDREPLLRLVESADQMAEALQQLHRTAFHDGLEEERWKASRGETIEARAQAMHRAVRDLGARLATPAAVRQQKAIATA